MVTVMDLVAQFFRISPQLVSKYAAQGQIYQIFYLVFFPTLFVLLFIYLLTSRGAIGLHRGFKVLISIAVYAFIILNGWYSYFIMLSEFWLFMLIILGGVYFFWARGGTKGGQLAQAGGGGQARGRSVFGNISGQLANRLKKGATHEIKDQETMIENQLKALEQLLNQYNNVVHDLGPQTVDAGNIVREWGSMFSQVQASIQQYRDSIQVGGFAAGGKLKHFQDRLESMMKKWDKAQK